jgi:hypothetical protein
MKLSMELLMKKRTGRATEVLWALQKLAADLEAEMDKMYKVGASDLTVNIAFAAYQDSLQVTLRGEV